MTLNRSHRQTFCPFYPPLATLSKIESNYLSNRIWFFIILRFSDNYSVIFAHMSIAKLLMSNPLDFNCEKNQREQTTFFPGYIQNFSGYSRLKVLVVTGKKCWLFPRIFFTVKSSGLDISNLVYERWFLENLEKTFN